MPEPVSGISCGSASGPPSPAKKTAKFTARGSASQARPKTERKRDRTKECELAKVARQEAKRQAVAQALELQQLKDEKAKLQAEVQRLSTTAASSGKFCFELPADSPMIESLAMSVEDFDTLWRVLARTRAELANALARLESAESAVVSLQAEVLRERQRGCPHGCCGARDVQ